MTTGDPGTEAAVTNSGNEQDAVFDFVIPQGTSGSGASPEFLTTYSTPPQPGTSGTALVFDQNGPSQGDDIAHTPGSANVTIQTPGSYVVAFHGSMAPASGVNFPLSLLAYLQQQGVSVPGTGVRQNFQTTSDLSSLSFTQIISVTTAPATLQVIVTGGNFLYSDISLSVYRLGDVS